MHPNIQLLSGATYTSQAFEQSLQAALPKAVVNTVADAAPGLRRLEHVMGMPIVVDVRDETSTSALLDRALRLASATSTRRSAPTSDDSEISRLDRGELARRRREPEVRVVLDRCERLTRETGGFFDVRSAARPPRSVGPRQGLVGRARRPSSSTAAGCANYAINAGGDIRRARRRAARRRWRIGIRASAASRRGRGRARG